MTTEVDPDQAVLLRWITGRGKPDPWLELRIQAGPLVADVGVDSRRARALALDVLFDQADFLGYQPPNPDMRESPGVHSFRTDARPWRRRRVAAKQLAERLDSLAKEYGPETFAAAINHMEQRP